MQTLTGALTGSWGWFVIGALLLVAEIFVPGAFLIWFGLAAIATGVLALGLDIGWQGEVLCFAVLALATVLAGRRLAPKPGEHSDRPFLNRRAESYVGRVFTLDEPILGGVGRVRIDDTVWRVEGPDLEAGRDVRVAAADGPTLRVVAA